MEQEAVPRDVVNEANAVVFNLLPPKSKERYINELRKFHEWMNIKSVTLITEQVLLAYFNGLLEKYAPSSLWSTYSMLKSTLFVFEKIDISK